MCETVSVCISMHSHMCSLSQSYTLESIVDVKICCSICGICLVSMATKDLPAGRVFWSLKQRGRRSLRLNRGTEHQQQNSFPRQKNRWIIVCSVNQLLTFPLTEYHVWIKRPSFKCWDRTKQPLLLHFSCLLIMVSCLFTFSHFCL